MRRLALFLPLLGLCAGRLAGESTPATPNTVVGTVASTPVVTVPQNGDAAAGKVVFKSNTAVGGCYSCHTLKDAAATGKVGPDLDQAKPEKDLILTRVVNGKTPMPAFKGTLTPQQIADVVAYVYSATHS